MNKPNTDYRLRIPTDEEMASAFGSIAECAEKTGGDMPTILFYLANPERIAGAPSVPRQPGEFASRVCELGLRQRADEAWNRAPKKTIAAVASDLRVDRSVARRGLVAAGKWPVSA